MSRKYYSLLDRVPGGKWAPQFGDYSRAAVAEEMADRKNGVTWSDSRNRQYKIICTDDDQDSVKQAVRILNGED